METTEVRRLLEKERLEKDALNRIKWDSRLYGQRFSITYVDRVAKKRLEAPYSSITMDGDFFHHNESQIPMHRIRTINYGGVVVWDKRKTA